MKALVTGASGFTGSYMVKNLLQHGYDVRVFVRQNSDTSVLKDLDVEYAYGDLTNPHEVTDAVKGVDKL